MKIRKEIEKYSAAILAIISIGILSGCDYFQNKLSRDKASKILEHSDGFKLVTRSITLGKEEYAIVTGKIKDSDSAVRNETAIANWVQQGAITGERIIKVESYISSVKYILKLTDEGKKINISKNDEYATFVICNRKVKTITGIVSTNDVEAIVDFDFTTENPTPLGLMINECDGKTYSAKSNFKKYDDGWRVENTGDLEPHSR